MNPCKYTSVIANYKLNILYIQIQWTIYTEFVGVLEGKILISVSWFVTEQDTENSYRGLNANDIDSPGRQVGNPE